MMAGCVVVILLAASDAPALLPHRTRDPAGSHPALASPTGTPDPGACSLKQPGSQTAPSTACAGCHGKSDAGINHPVDVDYEASERKSRNQLRPPAEVVRRGLLLPEGRIQCVTCHDANSPWKYHLVVPPGAPVTPASNPADRSSYERQTTAGVPAILAPGSDVGRKPLCVSCHSLD
jgi:hypothetical protein